MSINSKNATHDSNYSNTEIEKLSISSKAELQKL